MNTNLIETNTNADLSSFWCFACNKFNSNAIPTKMILDDRNLEDESVSFKPLNCTLVTLTYQ